MNQESLTDQPSEIIINILSRLPIRSIIRCKCVCKSWLHLLESPEFVKSHLSKPVSGLIVYEHDVHIKLFEFEDALNLENRELHYNLVTKVSAFSGLPLEATEIEGSANGLLFLHKMSTQHDAFYICNLITREYIKLPSPGKIVECYPNRVNYGFGLSKMTSQQKAVRIFHECIRDPGTHKLLAIPKSKCQVYTLGTGSWRSIAPGGLFAYDCRSTGAFLNGNLHWLVEDLKGSHWISCFDLETELFSILSPHPLPVDCGRFPWSLVVLGDCLCLCDSSSHDEIGLWLMKEYGVKKSWTKEFVISKIPDLAGESYVVFTPIKVSKDGDILMLLEDYCLFCYSNKTKTIKNIDMLHLRKPKYGVTAMLHTSSFLSLRSFGMENVRSF